MRSHIKKLRTLLLLTTMLNVNTSPAADNYENIKFIDLTGEKFNGNDEDLNLFTISGIRSGCGAGYVDTKNLQIISWQTVENRMPNRKLDSFVFNIEIIDRHGKNLFKNAYIRTSGTTGKGYVSHDICSATWKGIVGNEGVSVPVANIKYATIKYWISEIHSHDPLKAANEDQKLKVDTEKLLMMAKESKALQRGECKLDVPAYCEDYSKNVSFRTIHLFKKNDVGAEGKKSGFIVKVMNEKTESRFFFYKNAKDQANSASVISIYTKKDGLPTHFEWYGGKSESLDIHLEGIKKYLLSKGNQNKDFEEFDFLATGPNATYLAVQTQWRVTTKKAGIGPRPQEVDILTNDKMAIWQREKVKEIKYFETMKDCKENKYSCFVDIKKISEIKEKFIPNSSIKGPLYTYSFRLDDSSTKLTRGLLHISIDECNSSRQIQILTAPSLQGSTMVYPRQTECYEVK